MLWRIDGTKVYILGSIHVTNMNPVRLPALVEQVYATSTRTVFETDLDEKPNPSLPLLPNNDQLAKLLPRSLFDATRTHWLRFDLPESELNFLRPSVVAVRLVLAQAALSGYFSAGSVDRSIWERAKRDGKQRQGLEPFAAQLWPLVESPVEEQVSGLAHIVDQDDVGLSTLTGMVAAWNRGDIKYFETFLAQHFQLFPVTWEGVISKRNKNWVPSIAAIARDRTPTLVVVGTLHLAGPTGLPVLLEEHGVHLSAQK